MNRRDLLKAAAVVPFVGLAVTPIRLTPVKPKLPTRKELVMLRFWSRGRINLVHSPTPGQSSVAFADDVHDILTGLIGNGLQNLLVCCPAVGWLLESATAFRPAVHDPSAEVQWRGLLPPNQHVVVDPLYPEREIMLLGPTWQDDLTTGVPMKIGARASEFISRIASETSRWTP